MSVRRLLLDPILMQAAVEAGAEVRMAAKVTALVTDRGRVTGVRIAHKRVRAGGGGEARGGRRRPQLDGCQAGGVA